MKLLIVICLAAAAAADVSHVLNNERDAQTLRQDFDIGINGEYQWAVETQNGISAQAAGSVKNPNGENPAQVVQGQAQWTAPGGEKVQLQYVADENGFQAQGSHLPTPPPIPDAILRSLEYIRAHPPPQQQN